MATVAVVGCPRSGTTLLRTMLDRNPGLIVHPHEPQFFRGLEQRFGRRIRDRERAADYVARHPYVAEGMTSERILAELSGAGPVSVNAFIRAYVRAWSSRYPGRVPVLKGPNWIYHLPRLEGWFEGLRLVHSIRDPRGSVSSQIARWPQFSVLQCSARWRRAIRNASGWGATGRTPYFEVQYEHLLNAPDEPLERLCAFMGVAYTQDMLRFQQTEEQFEPGGVRTVSKLTEADPSRQDLWAERMSVDEIRIIETWCEREMQRLGYPKTQSPGSFGNLWAPYLRDGSRGAIAELRNRAKHRLRTWGLRTGVVTD